MTKRLPLPLNALRAFEAAARLGLMTRAADELAVTHGAVSRHIRQLEERLGVDLFAGSRHRPVLTAEGQQLLQGLAPAFDQIDHAVRAVSRHADDVLDVACLSTFAMRWLIPRLHRFQASHPTVEVRLTTDERTTTGPRNTADVVIAVFNGTKDMHANDAILFQEQLGVVVSPALLGANEDWRIEDLARLPRLGTRTRTNAWSMWLLLSDQAAMRLKPTRQFEHYTFVIEAVLSGLGSTVVPLHLVADDIKAGRLLAPFGFRPSSYCYAARSARATNRRARAFCVWLQRECAGDRAAFASSAHGSR